MFTLVPNHGVVDHQDPHLASGEPLPQIIDHRQDDKTRGKWLNGQKYGQQTYESLKEQRDNLVQSEFMYKKQIKDLEQEIQDLLQVYEPTYNENERLKGHINHGPDAQKIKKLTQEKKKLLSELDIVKDENAELLDRVKELEKMFLSEKDYYREKKWREAIERGRKRREENDSRLSTQGPFPNSKKPVRRDLKTVKDEEFERQDVYDLHIDNLEKETQIILNKIRHLKQNKENIDYANFIGKGAVTRNATVANAINEKLERDLVSFEERLENLRQKARKLNNGIAEDIIIPKKELKTKQTGTKYFRTRPTQTEPLPEQHHHEIETKNTDIQKKHNANGKPVLKSQGTIRIVNKEKEPLLKLSTHRDGHFHEETDDHVSAKHNKSSFKDPKQDFNMESKATMHVNWNVNYLPSTNVGYTSPIAEHWDNLASKLNETAKYGGKKPFTHTDKVARFKEVQTASRPGSYKQNKPFSNENEYRESEQTASNSAKSQRSAASVSSQSRLRISSQNKFELYRKFDLKSNADVEINADSTEFEPTRKTINTGEVIRFIPRQHSWEMNRGMKYTADQMGRYSNGPEPISGQRKLVKKVDTSEERRENNNSGSNQFSTMKKASETWRQGEVSDFYKTRQKKVIQSNDESFELRNTSAYDEVLADLRKQYKDQELTKNLKPDIKMNDKGSTQQQGAGNESSAENGGKQKATKGGIKRQNTYSLDLL